MAAEEQNRASVRMIDRYMEKLKVGLTQGDVNGISLETIFRAIGAEGMTEICTPVLFANKEAARLCVQQLKGENIKYTPVESASAAKEDRINLVAVGDYKLVPEPGKPSAETGRAALEALEAACGALERGEIDVLVTGPVNKSTVNSEEYHFTGHTEYLEKRLGNEDCRSQMILFDDNLKVALLTTHLPVCEVSGFVKKDRIIDAVRRLDKSLRRDFAIERPRIAVLALNPHSGDNGLLGSEEVTEISPAVKALEEEEILCFGPYAADGFFGTAQWELFDAVLAMYHDQGLAPFKALAGNSGVNFTAGLPYVRTSPDHGTAYDIAGQCKADPASMRNAVYKAIDIYKARLCYDEMRKNPLK